MTLELRNYFGLILWWLGSIVFVSAGLPEVYAQEDVQGAAVSKSRKAAVVPVHWPDLQQLESNVREHIKSRQDHLTSVLKDSSSSNAKLSETYGALGGLYQAYSLNAPARECYLNANQLSPEDFRWIYLLAKLDQQEGHVEEAIRRFQVAGSLRPDYVAVKVNLGNIYLELNRLEDAKVNLSAALEIEKNIPAAYYGLGQVSLSKRDYAEAVSHFQNALALAPEADRIHYALAMAYRGLGVPEKAKDHLARQGMVGVRVADPIMDGLQQLVIGARVHLIRGKQALEAKRFAEAVEEFRKAIAAEPYSLTAHVNMGAALTQIGDLKGAAEHFETALKIDPNNVNAHYNLAVLLANENKHELAAGHLRVVIRLNPKDLNARFLLARQLTRSGHLEEALEEFSYIAQADPNNEESLIEQVKLLYRKKIYSEALGVLEKAHAQYPQRIRTTVTLAYLLAVSPQYELRNGSKALQLSKTAYEATGSVQHGAVVGLALAELGRCNEAAAWQRKLIAAAAREGNADLQAKLQTDLQRYENVQSCRPSGDW